MTERETIGVLLPVTPDEETFYRELGERIAMLRRERGLTQVQLAKTLGISQQHMLSFEKGRRRMLAGTLPILSNLLGVSLEELVGNGTVKVARRGPTPKLQRQLERLSRLPRAQQQVVSRMLDGVLTSAGAER
jgi:transcriptional regulator with XRE-family HTH domain